MENENENYYIESLFVEIRVKNDLIFLFSDLYNEKQIIKELKDILRKIFLLNGFKVSETTINKYFNDYLNFICNNLKDNTIKNSETLKFYIENELMLLIENNDYLRKQFFNNEYKQIKNFLFVEIE